MKISAFDIQQIDRYLLGQMPADERLVFEAHIILSPELDDTVQWQSRVHELVKLRGRNTLRQEIRAVEQKLFSDPMHGSFKARILRLFGRS